MWVPSLGAILLVLRLFKVTLLGIFLLSSSGISIRYRTSVYQTVSACVRTLRAAFVSPAAVGHLSLPLSSGLVAVEEPPRALGRGESLGWFLLRVGK